MIKLNQEKKNKRMFSFHVVCISADKSGPHLKPHFKSMEHLEPSGDEGDGN